jgi:hypothetical protein
MQCYDIAKAGLSGNYEHEHFKQGGEEDFNFLSKATIARIRAAIQFANNQFSDNHRTQGHKYQIRFDDDATEEEDEESEPSPTAGRTTPKPLSRREALDWVKKMLLRSRGTELLGNFNPRLIAELFWEQSERWGEMARKHVSLVHSLCEQFVSGLLEKMTPKDVKSRMWYA